MESYGPRTRRSAARELAEGAGMARRTRSTVARAAAASIAPHAARSTRGARRTAAVAVAGAARRATTPGSRSPRTAVVAAAAASAASALPPRGATARQDANLLRTPTAPRWDTAAAAASEAAAAAAAAAAVSYAPANAGSPDTGGRAHSNKANGGGDAEAEGLRTPVARRGGNCAICLSPLKHAAEADEHRRQHQQSELHTIQGCGHKFHRACLVENRRAGNEGCPCCRGPLERGLTPAPTAAERRAAEEREAMTQAIENAQAAASSMVMEVSAAMRESREVRSAAEAALTRAVVAESVAAAAGAAQAAAAGAGDPEVWIAAATARGGVAVAVAEAAAAAERAADAADSTAISALGNLSLFGGSVGATIDGLTTAIEASRVVLAGARGDLESSRAAVNAVAMEGSGGEEGAVADGWP